MPKDFDCEMLQDGTTCDTPEDTDEPASVACASVQTALNSLSVPTADPDPAVSAEDDDGQLAADMLLDEMRAWLGGLVNIGDTDKLSALLAQNEISLRNIKSFSVGELEATGIDAAVATELLSDFNASTSTSLRIPAEGCWQAGRQGVAAVLGSECEMPQRTKRPPAAGTGAVKRTRRERISAELSCLIKLLNQSIIQPIKLRPALFSDLHYSAFMMLPTAKEFPGTGIIDLV